MGHSGTPPLLLPIVRTHSAQYCCPSPSACFLPPPPKHFLPSPTRWFPGFPSLPYGNTNSARKPQPIKAAVATLQGCHQPTATRHQHGPWGHPCAILKAFGGKDGATSGCLRGRPSARARRGSIPPPPLPISTEQTLRGQSTAPCQLLGVSNSCNPRPAASAHLSLIHI